MILELVDKKTQCVILEKDLTKRESPMPCVPSRKTRPPAADRVILDLHSEAVAQRAAEKITNNLSLVWVYKKTFYSVAGLLRNLLEDGRLSLVPDPEVDLAEAIL